MGPVQAKLIVTYPWKATQFDTTGMTQAKFQNEYLRKKREQTIAEKLTDNRIYDQEMYMNTVERHTDLHQKNVLPFTSRASNQSPIVTR